VEFRRILLPTDLSEEGERPFAAIRALAQRYGTTVVLLHVVEDIAVAPSVETVVPAVHIPGVVEEMKRVRGALEERKKKLFAGIPVEVDVISSASVPRAIAQYAVEKGCDLIAVSTHGRSGFRRMIMGSVAEAVLRHARVPVLAFPRSE
jgi:nucleotide-binding universal stress UspA family protein